MVTITIAEATNCIHLINNNTYCRRLWLHYEGTTEQLEEDVKTIIVTTTRSPFNISIITATSMTIIIIIITTTTTTTTRPPCPSRQRLPPFTIKGEEGQRQRLWIRIRWKGEGVDGEWQIVIHIQILILIQIRIVILNSCINISLTVCTIVYYYDIINTT